MPVRYLIALAGAAVLMAFVLGYEKGADSVRQGVAAESVRISEQARQKEKALQKKLNGITENYLHEIDEYKKTISAYADNVISVLTGCQARMTAPQQCPEIPQISPVLSVTPQPIYREKLKKVWILPRNATN